MVVPSQHWKTLLAKAAHTYQKALTANTPAGVAGRAYLTSRGITPEAINYFRLGLVDPPHDGHEIFTGRLCIPYITRTGIVSLRFRALNGEYPKYRSMEGTMGKDRLYNTRAFSRPEETLLLAEGEIDTMTASISGYAAVGISGATKWKAFYAPLFEGRRVVIVVDNDDKGAGRELAERVREDLPEARAAVCPPGHDLNSLYVAEGLQAVRELVRGEPDNE